MEDPRLADPSPPDDGRRAFPKPNDQQLQLSVVTEVDLAPRHYPISRVRWRQLISEVGD